MSTVKNFLLGLFNLVKGWLAANGFEGVLGLLLGLLLWSLGHKIFAGVAFGVFLTKNWDILKGWILSQVK